MVWSHLFSRLLCPQKQIRTVAARLFQGFLEAPFGHFRMIPSDEDFRNFPAAVFRRTRVMRKIQEHVTGHWCSVTRDFRSDAGVRGHVLARAKRFVLR